MSIPSWLCFVLAALAVWRVTHLLHAEDGPFDILVKIRTAAKNGFLGKLLDCFYCLSIWIAAIPVLILNYSWQERLLLWLSISAAAILFERLHAVLEAWEDRMRQPLFYEEELPQNPGGESDELLRKES